MDAEENIRPFRFTVRRFLMATPSFVMFLMMALGLVVVVWLGYCARSTPTDNVHFGSFNTAFVIVLMLYVLVMSRMPYINIVTDTFVDGMHFVSESIADKFNKHPPVLAGSTSPTTAAPGVVLPTTRPTDFVEWVSQTQIQPKTGATLPVGWRVSYSDGTNFGVVDQPIDVDAAKTISVYWDPDNVVHPGQTPLPTEVLHGRP